MHRSPDRLPTPAIALPRRAFVNATLAGAVGSLLFLSGCAQSRRTYRPGPQLPLQAPPPMPVSHRLTVLWLPASVLRHRALLEAASVTHRVDANLLAIMTLVESGGQPEVTSSAGAIGLMQVMPATGEDIASRRKLSGHTTQRLFEPAYNIDFGAWYVAQQVRSFWTGDGQRTVENVAAAYNGGPGRLRRHLKGGPELPEETRKYRRWVGGMWYERQHQNSGIYAEWMGAGGRRLVLKG